MNFLAHLYLSGENEEVMFGNFIGDAVKGNQFMHYNEEIRKGVLLHRMIDKYTDNHPIVEQSKIRLRNKYHKYSGVIIDMVYDHYLAVNWHEYSNVPLKSYVQSAYFIVLKRYFILPAHIKKILPFMIYSNWLASYANLDEMQKRFEGMSRRAKFESGMQYVIADIKNDYQLYEAEFKAYFPDIINYVKNQGF